MFSFASPAWLLLLLPIPACLFFYFFILRKTGGQPFAYHVWGSWGFIPRQSGVKVLIMLGRVLWIFTIILLILALARPSVSKREGVYSSDGAAILFLLDLSPSMAAVDSIPYTRLDRAKKTIIEFIQKRKNDSIGLLGFSSDVALLWPVSRNLSGAIDRLEELHVNSLGQGTAMGLGMAIAANHISKLANKKKLLIMLTDGSNNTGEIWPEGAANIIRNKGLDFYIIGLGQEKTRSALIINRETGEQYRGLLNETYNPIRLQSIAKISGGMFYNGMNYKTLSQNLAIIDKKEQVKQNIVIRVEEVTLEQYFILIAIIFSLLSLGIRLVLREQQL